MEMNDEFYQIIQNSLSDMAGEDLNAYNPMMQMWQVIVPMPGMLLLVDRDILRQYLEDGDDCGEEAY
nr:hypothetical protein [uncultured Mediterranean phage uvMED]